MSNFKKITKEILWVVLILSMTVSLNAGEGNKDTETKPEKKAPLPEVVSVKTGWTHTCALTRKGQVKCWGRNRSGRLGIGNQHTMYKPVLVQNLDNVRSIHVGGEHTCAVTTEGTVKCWGNNDYGQIGDGTNHDRYRPVDVKGLDVKVKTMVAGGWHNCALTESGGVKCWGRNENGRLGDATIYNRSTPTDVYNLTSGVAQVKAGMDHTCALTDDNKVLCWGSNYSGQLGLPDMGYGNRSLYPREVPGIEGEIEQLAAGWFHTCVLMKDNTVWCWGRNYNGELGDGTKTKSSKPVMVKGLDPDTVAIEAWSEHSCALNSKGGLKCWGRNDYGQLGDGTAINYFKPVDVVGLDKGVVEVTPGWRQSCALLKNGNIKCWGYNKYGTLGTGTRTQSYEPVDVKW